MTFARCLESLDGPSLGRAPCLGGANGACQQDGERRKSKDRIEHCTESLGGGSGRGDCFDGRGLMFVPQLTVDKDGDGSGDGDDDEQSDGRLGEVSICQNFDGDPGLD